MALYLTLKFAIKHANIGLIKRVIVYYCFIFASSKKPHYTQQALYFTHLLMINTAHPVLKRALLASILVNYYNKADSWFETDWLNKYHNLLLKLLLQSRAHSSIDITELFHKVSLIASYCLDLQEAIKYTFGKVNSTHHTMANTIDDIFKLGKKLYKEITKINKRQKSHLPNCRDIITVGNHKLTGYIKILVPPLPIKLKFNLMVAFS